MKCCNCRENLWKTFEEIENDSTRYAKNVRLMQVRALGIACTLAARPMLLDIGVLLYDIDVAHEEYGASNATLI